VISQSLVAFVVKETPSISAKGATTNDRRMELMRACPNFDRTGSRAAPARAPSGRPL